MRYKQVGINILSDNVDEERIIVFEAKINFLGGRFCSFSPCIEQSQRVCELLESNGFVEIQTMEILQIEHVIKTKHVPVMDFECIKTKVSFTSIFSKHKTKSKCFKVGSNFSKKKMDYQLISS